MGGETGIRDLLTGLFTRDYFDEVIGRELERSRRHNIALTVLSVVVSNRASLREIAGEDETNQVIAQTAKMLQSNVRETDSVFRWEEDEFIVLLFQTDVAAGSKKVQQLAALFRPWRDGDGPTRFPVKVRIGAATHDKDIVFPAVLQAARAAARQMTLH